MTFEVTRTFDILERSLTQFPREDALGGKNQKDWYSYSTAEYVDFSHHLALGLKIVLYLAIDQNSTINDF